LTQSAGILAFYGILWHFMAFYGILAFLPKSLIRNQIRFFPIFRLFPTFRLHNSNCDPIKTLARSALRWKSCCFQSGAGNMEGEFEDGFEGIEDSYQRLRAEHPLLPTDLREFQVLHTAHTHYVI